MCREKEKQPRYVGENGKKTLLAIILSNFILSPQINAIQFFFVCFF